MRKTLAWLALCAVVMGVVAPSISRVLVARAVRAADQFAVCEEHGLTLTDVPAEWARHEDQFWRLGQDVGLGLHGGHFGGHPDFGHDHDDEDECCPYCALIHHTPFVSAAAVSFAARVPPPDAHGARAAVSAPALRVGRRPHVPRAPPSTLA